MLSIRGWLIVLLLPCGLFLSRVAVAEDPRLGQQVFWKVDAKATVDGQPVGIDAVPFPAVASKVQDGRLWLKNAWVEEQGVMLPDDALEYYSQQIAATPGEAQLYFRRARLWFDKEDDDHLIEDMSESLRLQPTATAFKSRGNALVRKGRIDEALADYEQGLRLDPNLAECLVGRGEAWAMKEDWDRAIESLDEAIRLDLRDALAFANRGQVWLRKGDCDQAIRDFDEAQRLGMDSSQLSNARGCAWLEKGNGDSAAADFQQALRTEPDNALTYRNLGKARLLQEEYDQAIQAFSRAIELDGSVADAFRFRGVAWRQLYDNRNAIQDLSESLRLDPEHSETLVYRARLWLYEGDLDQAIADCTSALKLDPRLNQALLLRASAQHGKGQVDAALSDLTAAVDVDPTFTTARLLRGVLNLLAGRLDEAILDAGKVITADPNCASAYLIRGSASNAKGDCEGAIKDCGEAIRLDPALEPAYQVRASCCLRQRDFDGVIRDCGEAIRLAIARGAPRTGTLPEIDLSGEHDPYSVLFRFGWSSTEMFAMRGGAWRMMREFANALADYDEAARLDPIRRDVHAAAAWILATCPDARIRNGAEAEKRAMKACLSTDRPVDAYFDTLAAARAEMGYFDAAIDIEEKLVKRAMSDTEKETYTSHLAAYQAGKPWRDEPAKK